MTAQRGAERPILVIGGTGAVGRHIARRLLRSAVTCEVTLAGRNGARAETVARDLGSRAQPLALDATDRAAMRDAVAASGIVVLVTEAGSEVVASTSIETATPMLSVAAGVTVLRALDARDAEARAAGVAIVKDVGIAPGLVQMLALERLGPVDSSASLDIVVELGLVGRHGPEAVSWTLETAARASMTRIIETPSGPRRAIPAMFFDDTAFAEKVGAGSVRSYLSLVPSWTTGPLARIAPALRSRAGALHAASDRAAALLERIGVPTDQVRLGVWRTGPDSLSGVELRAREQSRLTGYLAAETARRLIATRPAAGVIDMSDLLSLRDLEPTLALFDARITAYPETV